MANTIHTHNGRPVVSTTPGWFQVADFRGRYVDIAGDDAQSAVRHFVESKTCNYDTPWHLSQAWRAAGCPTRAEWEAMQAEAVPT